MHREKMLYIFAERGRNISLYFLYKFKRQDLSLPLFFMSLKVTFQNLSLSGEIPIGFFVLLGLLKF